MLKAITSIDDKFWIHKAKAELALPCKKFSRLQVLLSSICSDWIESGEYKGCWKFNNAQIDAYLTSEDKVTLYDIMGELYLVN